MKTTLGAPEMSLQTKAASSPRKKSYKTVEVKEGKRGRKTGSILFPRHSLNEALKVPQVIWENNAGNPFPLLDVASKLGNSPTSSTFREIIRSAQRYGLTNESFRQDLTKTVSLSQLGNSIVAPTPEDDVNALKRKALETCDVFQKVFAALNGKIIPPQDVFKNMLIRSYQLLKGDADSCYDVLMKNISELGLSEQIQDKVYLRVDKLGIGQSIPLAEETEPQSPETGVEDATKQPLTSMRTPIFSPKQIVKVPRVFISHSKNKKILENMKQTLNFGKFDYRVAEEKETLSMPLSDKVFGLMQECNCAIINVSADQEKKQGETYSINENVLIEIGAAFLHYDRRVLLVIDQRLKEKLPSILQGITAIFYEGQELSLNDGMKLMKVLDEFRSKI